MKPIKKPLNEFINFAFLSPSLWYALGIFHAACFFTDRPLYESLGDSGVWVFTLFVVSIFAGILLGDFGRWKARSFNG